MKSIKVCIEVTDDDSVIIFHGSEAEFNYEYSVDYKAEAMEFAVSAILNKPYCPAVACDRPEDI